MEERSTAARELLSLTDVHLKVLREELTCFDSRAAGEIAELLRAAEKDAGYEDPTFLPVAVLIGEPRPTLKLMEAAIQEAAGMTAGATAQDEARTRRSP